MAFSRFNAGIALRVGALTATLILLVWLILNSHWYVTIALAAMAALAQFAHLVHFAGRSGREVARFLDALAFDDTSASFQNLTGDAAFADLGRAMARVMEQMRRGRAEREEQALYLQTLIAHVPVALLSVGDSGDVKLLNLAARRLFESGCTRTAQFSNYGEGFATGLEALKPGDGAIVRMERASGALQLKAAATAVALSGTRHRLISLQNIENELSAHELAAWQTVIRVMAHEMMNSLTPISSLSATAQTLVAETLADLTDADPHRPNLVDAAEALETIARRSEGLLHFVQNHRRITRRMVARVEIMPVTRLFARLQRLLAQELAARHIALVVVIEPPTLEIAADIELLDQALINLMRNAVESLHGENGGRITLSAGLQPSGRPAITVLDNGPGIAPEQREKVFVPFFTTKRQGSGVGLTLVRQIAAVHSASVEITETAGGGASVSIRF